jgi:hypothetical protein
MKNLKPLFLLLAGLFFLSSCLVSKKKYTLLQNQKSEADSSIARLQEDTAKLNYVILELTALNTELKKTVENRKVLFEDRLGRPKIKKRTISSDDEFKNKAGLIYQFTKYVQFTNKHQNEYTIAVLGKSAVFSKLRHEVQNKTVGDKKIHVIHYTHANAVKDCNMLFVSANSSSYLGEVLVKLNKNLPLIITEKENLLNYGSHINFFIDGDSVHFRISENNVSRAKILVASSLTNLAR